MLNTVAEKLQILSLYEVSVTDRLNSEFYVISYLNKRFYYNKTNFNLLKTSDVISYIIIHFELSDNIYLKEKFLIDNNIRKYWVNSHFYLIKNKQQFKYPFSTYKNSEYEDFVLSVNERYEKCLKLNPYGNYLIKDDDSSLYTACENTKNDNIFDVKKMKENIRKLLIERKFLQID